MHQQLRETIKRWLSKKRAVRATLKSAYSNKRRERVGIALSNAGGSFECEEDDELL